jgi:hypothetical protein
MNLHPAFGSTGIMYETQLSEPVHEETDSGTSCTDHFSQGFLTDFGHDCFWNALFTEMSQQ